MSKFKVGETVEYIMPVFMDDLVPHWQLGTLVLESTDKSNHYLVMSEAGEYTPTYTVRKPKLKFIYERWVNVYINGLTYFGSKGEADQANDADVSNRIALKKILINGTEGDES